MATQIDVTALTLNPEEATDIASLVIERGLVNGDLAQIHDIQTGITHKKQIPFAGAMTDSLKKATGCTPNPGSGIVLSEKFWDPEIFDSRWIHCAADLDRLLKLFNKAQRINPDFYDKIDSEELGLIFTFIERMLTEAIPEKVWFSDRSADVVVNGGVFTAGTDLDLYNVIDGIFKEIFADANIPKIDIDKNAGASYAAQALAEDDAYNTLIAMSEAANPALLADPNQEILMTLSMAQNYRSTLRKNTLINGFTDNVETGKKELQFEGVKIVVMHEWDRFIKANQDNGTKHNLPHRVVWTVPGNIPIGTTSTDDFDTLDSFYDRTLKSNIIDVALSLDAKHLESTMSVVAY